MNTHRIHRWSGAWLALTTLCAVASAQQFEAPVQLKADGVVIDTGEDIGHAGPLVRDHDGDGLPDLLVSSFRGNIRFFKNVGAASDPVYEEQGKLQQVDGSDIRIHNW